MLDREELWNRIYNFDGRDLADYLNAFCPDIYFDATRYGEQVFGTRYEDEGIEVTFGAWSKWREQVSYYFEGFCDTVEQIHNRRLFTEEDIEIFVYKLCGIVLGIWNDMEPPPGADKYLFC